MTISFHDTNTLDTAFKTGPHASLSVQQLATNHQDNVNLNSSQKAEKVKEQFTNQGTSSFGTLSFSIYLVCAILALSAFDALTEFIRGSGSACYIEEEQMMIL